MQAFVFALRFFGFALVALQRAAQTYTLMQILLPAAWNPPPMLDWFVRILFPTCAVLAVRRAYAGGRPASIAAGAAMMSAVLMVSLYVYRAVQFAITFALT
jgi:hypothetical protein